MLKLLTMLFRGFVRIQVRSVSNLVAIRDPASSDRLLP